MKRNKYLRNIILYISLSLSWLCVSGCSYNELPPKTENASSTYLLPKGSLPTNEEQKEVEKIKQAYDNYIENSKIKNYIDN